VHLFFLFFVLPFLALHFLPTIIAAARHARNLPWILLLNLLLSWTIVGWLVALIWALCDAPHYAVFYNPPLPAAPYDATAAPPYN
jgi:hypothetical protein